MMGLDQVKGPHWSQILGLFGPNGSISNILADRSQVQLKDKARNLKLLFLKTDSEVPYYLQGVTGELKTRAANHAVKKEAKERARMNSEDDQARMNGISTLGSMHSNGTQKGNSSIAAPRSGTPGQGITGSHPGTPSTQPQSRPSAQAPVPTIPPAQPVHFPRVNRSSAQPQHTQQPERPEQQQASQKLPPPTTSSSDNQEASATEEAFAGNQADATSPPLPLPYDHTPSTDKQDGLSAEDAALLELKAAIAREIA